MIDSEFTQLIKGYQGERLRQAFRFFDKDDDGYINPDEFQRIIVVSGCSLSSDHWKTRDLERSEQTADDRLSLFGRV